MAARNTLALCLLVGLAQARKPDVVVELGANAHVPLATQFAAQSCIGLMNRDATTTVFALMVGDDNAWSEILGVTAADRVWTAAEFLESCVHSPLVKGVARWNVTAQKAAVPQIVTVAGVRDLLLLEDGLVDHDLPVVFDATKELAGASERDATRYVFDRFANETTTMAKMDPGYEGKPPHAALTGTANPALVDFIVKEKLFNFFLYDGCVPLTKDHALMEEIVANNPWPEPIVVYGYDDSWPLAGDLFEAETTCAGHAMGQVASNGFSNLGFFSVDAPTETPKVQPFDHAATPAAYDGGTTYVSFVVGDGDNLEMVKGSRRQWMAQRVANWTSASPLRFPITWTLSPRALQFPALGNWFFEQAAKTRADAFVLPPSGDLYAYPSEMDEALQRAFVNDTARDAYLLNSSATVAWEFLGSWTKAIADFFPKYAATRVAGLFAVNVPYLFPIVDFGFAEQYKVLSDDAGNRAVLFRPNEWRGTTCPHGCATHEALAKKINGLPTGSVAAYYATSDGGFDLGDLYATVPLLGDHVTIVDANALAGLALQRSAAEERG